MPESSAEKDRPYLLPTGRNTRGGRGLFDHSMSSIGSHGRACLVTKGGLKMFRVLARDLQH